MEEVCEEHNTWEPIDRFKEDRPDMVEKCEHDLLRKQQSKTTTKDKETINIPETEVQPQIERLLIS